MIYNYNLFHTRKKITTKKNKTRYKKKKYMNDLITNTTKEANDLHLSYSTTPTRTATYHLVVGVNRCRCPREGLGPRGVGSGH